MFIFFFSSPVFFFSHNKGFYWINITEFDKQYKTTLQDANNITRHTRDIRHTTQDMHESSAISLILSFSKTKLSPLSQSLAHHPPHQTLTSNSSIILTVSVGMKLGFSFFFLFLSVMEKRERTEGERVKEFLQNEDYRLTCFYSLKVLLRKLVN